MENSYFPSYSLGCFSIRIGRYESWSRLPSLRYDGARWRSTWQQIAFKKLSGKSHDPVTQDHQQVLLWACRNYFLYYWAGGSSIHRSIHEIWTQCWRWREILTSWVWKYPDLPRLSLPGGFDLTMEERLVNGVVLGWAVTFPSLVSSQFANTEVEREAKGCVQADACYLQ